MSTEKTYLCDEYKLYFKIEDDVQILHNEVELYNTSFVGNNSFCHEEYIDGQRALTYSIPAMITMNQFITKKIHRDELVDIMFSIADQLMYLKANDMPLGKVILNIGYMYLNLEDMSVQLVFLPIDKPMEKCNMEKFVRDLVNKLDFANKKASDCGYELIKFFDHNPSFYLSEFYKMITDIVDNAVDMCFSDDVDAEEWDLNEFNTVLRQIIPIEPLTPEKVKGKKKNEMKHLIKEEAVKLYEAKESEFPEPEQLRELERVVLLKSIDSKWMDHIDDMEILRQGIGLVGYGQRDPVVEYKMSAYDMFNEMTNSIQEDTVRMLYHVHVEQKIEREQVAKVTGTNKDDSSARKPVQRKEDKVYPNDPCPCGSGKKYKQCCGRKMMKA